MTENRTTLVIAHRLSTIIKSKIIYVIEAGQIVAEGSHDELLKKSSIYKNFYEKQLRKESVSYTHLTLPTNPEV